MNLLLDTHIFLWYILRDPKLPVHYEQAISDLHNEVYLRVVSVWETIIKYSNGKLDLPAPPHEYMPRQRRRHLIRSLEINEEMTARLGQLPSIHRDPFDRMRACQAIDADLTVMTADTLLRRYPIRVFGEE